jgi:hypothetical protein
VRPTGVAVAAENVQLVCHLVRPPDLRVSVPGDEPERIAAATTDQDAGRGVLTGIGLQMISSRW